ncbi:ABC transporter related protein [Evansella cellulosilytica DSM 2522]|uniref:Energy-coupling factor transporter ATP-binding protein EcfA2 n=1 Tax=Evansella cellulosilytica (strain ATCC 21833 / DSM 2522 / FERM P-1141 / JCM 9156 / N-4) TaxID=649639 RepID=E6U1E4_EVAC2|nr:ABC transporter related protein [Evansella cellulosilytica DSM 2522]
MKLEHVTADYQLGPIRSFNVLQDVEMKVESGSFTAVIGKTGAGKSSLLKIMNGLLLPKQGKVTIGDAIITPGKNKKALKSIRKRVGMVFQFPESQLFAETVEQDICFGPLNFGASKEEAKELARKVIKQVGLTADILSKSPFTLSGGQKRRIAIAGILAMEPDILVLDEPGAGLDPKGKLDILSSIASWHKEQGLTTLIVTHDMEDVAQFANNIVIMDKGTVVLHDAVRNVFSNKAIIDKWQLDVPEALKFQMKIEEKTGVKLPKVCLTIEELTESLIEAGLA